LSYEGLESALNVLKEQKESDVLWQGRIVNPPRVLLRGLERFILEKDHSIPILLKFEVLEVIMVKKSEPVNYKLMEDISHIGLFDSRHSVTYIKHGTGFQEFDGDKVQQLEGEKH
jgi:hypothetical protein